MQGGNETAKERVDMTREDWLNKAAERLAEHIGERTGTRFTARIRISCGFPKSGGGARGAAIGQAWDAACSGDKTHEIFISPVLNEPCAGEGVLSTLLHEMIHAHVGVAAGHKGPFRKAALACGLEGKMTATHASADLIEETLRPIADACGPYPHAAMTLPERGKKGSRLIKVECASCGYIARVTRKWVDELGTPLCPCNGEPMLAAG